MGIWNSLFGSDKIIDAGINGIDQMVFTDEEKSSAKMRFLKLYEPFKLAQRYIAMTFCPAYIFMWIVTGLLEVANIFIITFSDKSLNTDVMYKLLSGDIAMMVMLILGFYFGGGAIEGVVKRFGKK
ncbi:MAG: hypothetical protein Unbinned5350contig1004_51 [Prokaryotic dsDNA virus sp.]|nr:MAG: hypothetical protein Unbinned5350contig1004_51 [Prokaryotic dsDNA virus sp.]|tara:strand:+ start:3694 stop:4071 length:378 start_codon:yes stop_codon:yes gene_type:complete